MGGSLLVNLLKPTKESTFVCRVCQNCLCAKVTKEQQTVEHIDIVFDTYKKDSLKGTTQQKRGMGIPRKVKEQSQAPTNWYFFLGIDKNKTELFRFLSEQIITNIETSKIVVAAYEDRVLTLKDSNVGALIPCNHEEANTRIFLHALGMRRHSGIQGIMIKTVDTDVVVLAVALFPELSQLVVG